MTKEFLDYVAKMLRREYPNSRDVSFNVAKSYYSKEKIENSFVQERLNFEIAEDGRKFLAVMTCKIEGKFEEILP